MSGYAPGPSGSAGGPTTTVRDTYRISNLDSTTANINSGASYTGAYVELPIGTKSIQLTAVFDTVCEVHLDFSDNGSTARYRWSVLVGADPFNINVNPRGRYVRMVIKNSGYKDDGTTANNTTSVFAQIEASGAEPAVTRYKLRILNNVTVTATITGPSVAFPHAWDLYTTGFRIHVVGTVTGTSPTLASRTATSADGTNFVSNSGDGANITATNAMSHSGVATYEIHFPNFRWVVVVGGTTPSFGGTYGWIAAYVTP